jgi:hypothetical protein
MAHPASADEPARLYRIRVPGDEHSTAVTVRLTDDSAWVAVGSGRRRLPLSVPEAWALFRALAEALDSAGDPPEFIRTPIKPTSK